MNQDNVNFYALKSILEAKNEIKQLTSEITELKRHKLITNKKLLDDELSLGIATTDLEQALNANKVLSDELTANKNLYANFHRRLYRNMRESKASQARTTAMRMISEFNGVGK